MQAWWVAHARRLSIWSVVTATTLGFLAACGGGDDAAIVVPVVPTEPQSVAAVATPTTVKSVTVSWTAPTAGQPITSYNLYRSITPDIASDPTAAQKFENVTSPYVDSVPAGGVPFYYVVQAVNAVGEGPLSAEASATPTVPASGDSGFGNNLSVPIVFADGLGLFGDAITGADSDYLDRATGLRPTLTDTVDPFPFLRVEDVLKSGGVDYYVQKNPSSWQASWKNGAATPQSVVVDWGDNLTSASITTDLSIIRVETNLLQDKGVPAAEGLEPAWPDTESMLRYPMKLLAGQGATEVQGTTGVAEEATQRRVFTVNARLTIQRLDDAGQVDPAFPNGCLFDKSIAESYALPDNQQALKYSTEINVAGAITYGYNWRLNSCGLPPEQRAGKYRITFSLDTSSNIGGVDYPNNVSLDALDAGDLAGGKAVLVDSQTSYIDVVVTQP